MHSITKTVLMIAFHFPPTLGSSGTHRTLSFARYLPEHGWRPIVLTAGLRAYPTVEKSQNEHVPHDLLVERAFAIDSARHLAVRGVHLQALALPDRWISWWPAAVAKGLRLVRKHRPAALWSTYPIATAHLIGLALHRITGVPWIADFRDPMVETDPLTGEEHPQDPALRRMHTWIERATMRRSEKAVFTTPGAAQMYRERYPGVLSARIATIANGFDEESFRRAGVKQNCAPAANGKLTLLHSGVLYPQARDPRAFFAAVAELRRKGTVSSETLRIVFRGSGSEGLFRSLVREMGLEDLIFLEPMVPYTAALREMATADGLLIFQAANCNSQIPAKLYEYLRAMRPVLALTDPRGDTAQLLSKEGVGVVAPLDSESEIAQALAAFLASIRSGSAPRATKNTIERYSRRARTRELVKLLDSLAA